MDAHAPEEAPEAAPRPPAAPPAAPRGPPPRAAPDEAAAPEAAAASWDAAEVHTVAPTFERVEDDSDAFERVDEESDRQDDAWADAPQDLVVVPPSDLIDCAGRYLLVPSERPNGAPLWKQSGGAFWLYCGTTGKWYIGGFQAQQRDFQCAMGYIRSREPHGGATPDQVDQVWQWGDGTDWRDDIVISISPPTAAAAAAEAGGEGTGAARAARPHATAPRAAAGLAAGASLAVERGATSARGAAAGRNGPEVFDQEEDDLPFFDGCEFFGEDLVPCGTCCGPGKHRGPDGAGRRGAPLFSWPEPEIGVTRHGAAWGATGAETPGTQAGWPV